MQYVFFPILISNWSLSSKKCNVLNQSESCGQFSAYPTNVQIKKKKKRKSYISALCWIVLAS